VATDVEFASGEGEGGHIIPMLSFSGCMPSVVLKGMLKLMRIFASILKDYEKRVSHTW
jgi:hypothetical protein